ncbi:hypothetical protein [Cohnella zeiphila]|uniref:Tail fiber protein n=1 Tax=Cohnella zeiphila TaxID=2761120 RepID=A0A7X0SHH9_9BACL|nr:hypothetical protein [Cohnella zeiphila]MBB6730063.1 hypothetical protein [Cohnella zeiphila]
MSLFTSVWNLLKKNPATDGNDIFNVQTMLNDNWDRLDAALGMKAVNADVRVATVGNIGLSGLQTIDGVTLTAGDRVLVKDQATGRDNGIYIADADAWSRAPDADSSTKLSAGLFVHVKEGSSNAGTGWMLATAGAVTLGSTTLTFVQKTGAGAATDAVIGTRTIDDSVVASSGADTPTRLWSKFAYMIRAMTGKANWYTPPATTLEAANSHIFATNGVHGATSTATASRLVQRDVFGRAQFDSPAAASDAATKGYADDMPRNMAQQAIINGNFDIWQRGKSFVNLGGYFADRWKTNIGADGGAFPNIIISRERILGDIQGASYYARISSSGAGTLLGPDSEYSLDQNIEFGTWYLCGTNKKVTLSFLARSDIPNKRIGATLFQSYGTGGMPSNIEDIPGINWTLSTSWQRFSYTFTTKTLIGKTYGSNEDGVLLARIYLVWGKNRQSRVGATSAETFQGAGTTDIAQVQLNAGDTALPFQPRSFAEELTLCQRYFEKSYDISTTPGTITDVGRIGGRVQATGNFAVECGIRFRVAKRISPTVQTYSPDSGNPGVWSVNGVDVASNIGSESGQTGTLSYMVKDWGQNDLYKLHWTADAEY